MRPVGVYAGTFDPFTRGHVDIVRRATHLVNHLVVGVAANLYKQPLFSVEERVSMAKNEVAGIANESKCTIEVRAFEDLLIHFARDVDATILIRGLRAVSDFEFEYQMVGMNRAMDNNIETVFLMADIERQVISSRLVKEVCRLGGDVTDFVSDKVAQMLEEKWSGER